ncbi:unnamed protein product [Leptosia nina]|uniref:Uncharacterized protein n=1 Tax=Leptosia nina TaxID=320188 RepID=A0AAV1JN82_9NEOP
MLQYEYEPEMLIEAVKKRPGLWDYDNPDYRLKALRHKLWVQVVKEVAGTDADISKSDMRELELQLQKKWKSIRDNFQKYVANPSRTRKPYVYCRHLEFLLKRRKTKKDGENEQPEIPPRAWKTVRKIKLTRVSSDEEQDFYYDDLPQEPSEVEITPTKPTDTEFVFASVDGNNKPASEGNDDSDKMFLLSLLPHLKAIPEENRLGVKMELMQVLRNSTNT